MICGDQVYDGIAETCRPGELVAREFRAFVSSNFEYLKKRKKKKSIGKQDTRDWYSRDSLCYGVGAHMADINAKMQKKIRGLVLPLPGV